MAKATPPCDGTSESWALYTLLAISPIAVIELMHSSNVDRLVYTIAIVTLGLWLRHHRRFHRPEPVEAPAEEAIR